MMNTSDIRIDGVNLRYAANFDSAMLRAVGSEAGAPADVAAPAIFFFHGNSSSHASWLSVLESEALKPYCCVAFDLPAHGGSDAAAAATDDYSLPGMAALLAKAVARLAAGQPFILVGSSLGANILAEMLLFVHPVGIGLIGPSIVGGVFTPDKALKPDPRVALCFGDAISEAELEDLMDVGAASKDRRVRGQMRGDIRAVKDGFRSRFAAGVAAGKYNDEVALIRDAEVPVALVFGEDDLASNTDYLDTAGFELLGDKMILLPGAGHFAQIDDPGGVTAVVAALAEAVFGDVRR